VKYVCAENFGTPQNLARQDHGICKFDILVLVKCLKWPWGIQ